MPPAAATFTVATDDARAAAVLTIALPATATKLNVWRVSPSGATGGVRGAYPRTGLSGSATTLVVRDFEVPLGVDLDYYTQAFDAAGNGGPVSGPVTFAVYPVNAATSDDWLVDLVRSANTLQVRVESLAQLAYQQIQGTHHVLGRRTPVITSDIAGTPEFELVFTADHFPDARDAIRNMLGTGTAVLLRTVVDRGVGNMYFLPASWVEARASRIAMEQTRRFIVQGVQVDRPDATLMAPIPPVTYADVEVTYPTYAAMRNYGTYDQIAYNYSAVGSSTIQLAPWPSMDV